MTQQAQAEQALTEQEAVERARLIRVDRYDIDVDLTDLADGAAFQATSNIVFGCSDPGASTFVDCVAKVRSATLNGRPLDADGAAAGRLHLPDLEAANTLVVESVQRATDQASGIQRTVDKSDNLVYVWTSFEPDDARRAWACFDQPDLKAVHRITVTAPAEWEVLSNTVAERVEDVDAGRRWHFADTPPLSTYVPVVNAGPFYELRAERGGYDLGLYSRRSLAGQLDRDAEELFDLTARGLAFFGERFDLPFPQRKYDQVFVPDMGGAMENWGCVTWSDDFVFRTDPTQQEREIRARVLLHEMAHMWFGDLVTLRWWNDLWLNESFAEWASCWAATEATEFTDVWATIAAVDKLVAYAADLAPSRHPISQPVPDVAAAKATFDAITYRKGSSVLKQLFNYVGQENLLGALRAYFKRHAYANATFGDMIHELEQASDRDLSSWTEGWLERAGTDILSLQTTDGDSVLRAEGPDGEPARPHRLDIGCYDRDGEGFVRRGVLAVETTGQSTALPDLQPADLWLVNDNDLTFATVRPDPESLRLLLTSAGGLPTALARALAVSTARDHLFEGEIGVAEVVGCVNDVLLHETALSVVEPFLYLAAITAERWSPLADRDRLLASVADTCLQLLDRADVRRVALRTLAETASTPEQVDSLRAEIGDDVDLQWRLLAKEAQRGRFDEAEVRRLAVDDPDPDAWVRALAVESAQPDEAAKERVWTLVFDRREVPAASLREIGPAFWTRGEPTVLEPFLDRYLESLPSAGDRGMLAAMAGSMFMFPWGTEDPDAVRRLNDAASDDRVSPVVRRIVVESSDQLRRMMVSRQT